MFRRVLIGCGALSILGVGAVIVLVVGVLIGSTSGTAPDSGGGGGDPIPDAGAGTVTVRVTGTEGIPFSGSIGNADGSRTVQGAVPDEFTVKAESLDVVTALIQKEDVPGRLTAEIVRGGEVVKHASTKAAYGAVTVTYDTGF